MLPSFCLTSVIGSRYAYTPHRERIYTYIQRAFSGLYQIGLVPSVHPVKDCYLSYQTKCYFQDGPMYFFWKLQWESRSLLRAQIQASVSIFRDVNKGKRKKIYQVSGKGAVFAPLRYMSKFWNFWMKNSWCKHKIKQMNESLLRELLNVVRSPCVVSREGAKFVTEDQSFEVCINWPYSCNSDQTVVNKSFLTNEKMLPFLCEEGPGCYNTYLCRLEAELLVCFVVWVNRRSV